MFPLDRRSDGRQTDLNVVAKRKILTFWDPNPSRPVRSLVSEWVLRHHEVGVQKNTLNTKSGN
jgi:hypothetical protein